MLLLPPTHALANCLISLDWGESYSQGDPVSSGPAGKPRARKHYDVIVVGSGPAGIFAALEIARSSDLRVLLVEQGPDVSERRCLARTRGVCAHCSPCHITTGWGGAGAFSDGKLTLSAEVGGWLSEYLGHDCLQGLIREVDSLYRSFGAPAQLYGAELEAWERWAEQAAKQGLRLVYSPVRHMGTERAISVLSAMRTQLENRIDILTGTAAVQILTVQDKTTVEAAGRGRERLAERPTGRRLRVAGVVTADGVQYQSTAVIAAPGRAGSVWLAAEAERLGIPLKTNPVDIGVRVEVPAVLTDSITDELYEPKLIFTARRFEDQVRTFCMNPGGVVCTESWGDAVTVNGHSYGDTGKRTANTNFALLVSTRFTEPFNEPIEYGKSIARLANMLGRDVLVQRLADLRAGRRSTPERLGRSVVRPTLSTATPGDLSFALPFRHLQDIIDMLEALDALLPGVGGRDTLIYGVEVKFYSMRVAVDANLETPVRALYAVGDGAGITRGLVQASASGLVAARSILGSF